MHIAQVNFC